MKKILYICDQNPFEHNFGSQQRTHLLFNVLCEKGNVDLVCYTNDQKPEQISNPKCTIKYFGRLPEKSNSKLFTRIIKILNILSSFSPYSVYDKNKEAAYTIRKLIKYGEYDFIVIRYIKNAFISGLLKGDQIIVDIDDLPENSFSSYIHLNELKGVKFYQYKFYEFRAKYHTDRFVKKIQYAFLSNKLQCRWENSSLLSNIPFMINKNGKDSSIDYPHDSDIIIFVGYMLHTPNLYGIQYFLENIWKDVKNNVPNAVFKIIGQGVSKVQKDIWEKFDDVIVAGFVDDLSHEYNTSKVVIAPIYSGGGSNIKILEGMYMHKAMVISSFAAVPFANDLIDDYNIMIAEDSNDFSEKVIKLLIDKEKNKFIAGNAKKMIDEKYTYKNFRESVNKVLN